MISAIFLVFILIVFVLAYIMSNIAHILKGQKILFWSFLFRLGENFLEFYLLLIVLFFLNGKDKQKKKFDSSAFSPNIYLKLKSIVLNYV